MQFTPTELELRVMRALDHYPWRASKAIAETAGDDVRDVRSALAELRRFELVTGDGRLGGGKIQRFHLTKAGQAVLIDTLRRRTLESCQAAAA